ncbi:MAG: PAS domain S-box protein [Deltaproteobacteria bacterium]
MTFLDMRTIIFSYALTAVVCVLVITLLWLQNRKRFQGSTFWVVDFLCQTAALFLIILRGNIPDWASIVLANSLVLIGAFLGYIGLLRFVGERSSQIHNYIILALLSLVHVYLTFVQPDLHARAFNTSAGLLIICFQCSWLMLYRVPAGLRPLTRGVGITFGLYCLVSIIRMVYFFTGAPSGTDFFHSNSLDALAMVAYQTLFILLTYSLALMLNQRLTQDVATQEEKFSRAFHSSPYAILLTRLSDGRIIEVNDGFVDIFGYQYADVKEESTPGLRIWDKPQSREALISDLLGRGKVRRREFQFRKKSGELIDGLFSAEVITINHEKCILSSIDDISARKRAEEALQASNSYLERLNNALADAIFVVKYPERVVEYLNDAATAMFGYSREEVLGKNGLLFYPDQAGYLRSHEFFQEAIQEGKNLARFETTLKRKNGGIFPVWFTATFLKENDRITKFIVIVQDITEQKRDSDTIRQLNLALEQRVADRTKELNDTQVALLNLVDDLNQSTREINSANRSLEAVNQELASFSYTVSHDLRAPLRSISGFSAALQEDYGDRLGDEGKNYLERIQRATQVMGQLIDDLLNLSRVTKAEFYRQDFDLSGMVRELAEAEQQKNPLANLAIDIQEGIVVRADQRLMNIAMINLLDNAWKFTGKKEHPHIEFGAEIRNDETVIFVRDNGAGFNMAYVDKIFGAFQRLHKVDDYPGTGIGLATVRRIIERHGGRIWAEGEVGKGAAFFFTLEG